MSSRYEVFYFDVREVVECWFNHERGVWGLHYNYEPRAFAYVTEEEWRRCRSRELLVRHTLDDYKRRGAASGADRQEKEDNEEDLSGTSHKPPAERDTISTLWQAFRDSLEGAGEGVDGASDTSGGEALEKPLAGWRRWRGSGPLLLPVAVAGVWDIAGVNTAVCACPTVCARIGRDREVPGRDCSCGFHAYRSYELMDLLSTPAFVDGVVALGGEVQEHKYGMRAEQARIVALLDSPNARLFKLHYEHHVEVGSPETPSICSFPTEKFPLPILSASECELLAIDQGCIFESEPARRTSEKVLAQYLVPGAPLVKAPNIGNFYPTLKRHFTLGFAPVDEPMCGGIRIDQHLSAEIKEMTLYVEGAYVTLHIKEVYFEGKPLRFWTLAEGTSELDLALCWAFDEYEGREWLRHYRISDDS